MEAATPAGTARAEDPGLSAAREATEAVPAESVRRNEHQRLNASPRQLAPRRPVAPAA
ncbi:hypothetical protein [Planococcus sp. A6]|uniref:hypothetical protein n=1 Tax=Planococcus sp. A6 TaxID=2992760 RepID=UPI00237B0BA5|nr:hypothetical protein [Planococcus sp. A6]